jgi:outer membrane protein, heavy metal efflux system
MIRGSRTLSFRVVVAALVAGLPLLSGCTTTSGDNGLADVQSLVAERIPQRVTWDRGGPEDQEADQLVASLLQQQLTPDSAVQIALLRNADLQATFEDLGIAQADLVQAGLLANPIFDFELRLPAHPHRPFEVHVIEDFMNVFTRPLRERTAAVEFEAAKARVANAVLDLAADVRAAFYEVQETEQLVELHASVVSATGAAADAGRRMRDAGNIPELESANRFAADGDARLALLSAEADRLEKREHLSALLGLWGADIQWTVAGRLPELPADDLPPESLESLAIAQRLDLAAAVRDIETAGSALDLTDTTALIPNFDVGLHSEREPGGQTTIGPSIGFPIPLFDQGQGRRARDEALLRRSQQKYIALAVQIRSQVRALRGRLLAARARTEYLRDVVLPLRERIVQQTQLQYNGMQLGVFELLAARRADIDAGRDLLEAQASYWLARNALERAVGGTLQPPAAPGTSPAVAAATAASLAAPATAEGGTP